MLLRFLLHPAPLCDHDWFALLPAPVWGVLAQFVDHAFERGPGGYFSWAKIIYLIAAFLLWVAIMEWANKDTQKLNMQFFVWHPVLFFPFVVAFFLAISIPSFAVGGSILAACLFVPSLVYLVQRNAQVAPHLKVLTPDHMWFMTAKLLQRAGLKVQAEKRAMHEKGPPVVFHAMGGATDQEDQANNIRARQSEGYVHLKELIADAHGRRVDKIMLEYGPESVTARYQIDGAWHEADSQEREAGDLLSSVVKWLCNLDPAKRKSKQEGFFRADYKGDKIRTKVLNQATKTGERLILHMDRPVEGLETMLDLGMREKMQDQLRDILQENSGMILFSSLPTGGVSTTISCALKLADRFLNDFSVIYGKNEKELTTENLTAEHYDLAKGQKPDRTLLTTIRKDPDAIVMPEMHDEATVKLMCQFAKSKKLVVTSIRAKEGVEALLRVLMMGVPADAFAPVVVAVVNQRLVRKLCEACKQPYKPSAELLKKLGLPAGRVESFYKPPEPDDEGRDEVCKECDGIGYIGRTSVFELLVVDDSIRTALIKQPKLEILRKLARQKKHRSLQEEGILLVARGITSLPELQRALKG